MQPPRFIAYVLGLPRLIGFLLALSTVVLGILMLGVAYTTPSGGAFSNTAIFLFGFVLGGIGSLWMLYVLGVR